MYYQVKYWPSVTLNLNFNKKRNDFMTRYNLGFISDEAIFQHVKDTVEKYRFVIDLKKFNKNIIDPIKMTFDTKIYRRSVEQAVEDEVLRQLDKSNNNHIGYFNQNLFKFLDANWIVPKTGFDVVNAKEHIFVEMKKNITQ